MPVLYKEGRTPWRVTMHHAQPRIQRPGIGSNRQTVMGATMTQNGRPWGHVVIEVEVDVDETGDDGASRSTTAR